MPTLVQFRKYPNYDDDLALWTDAQIRLLLDRRFSELDITNLVAELDSMNKRDVLSGADTRSGLYAVTATPARSSSSSHRFDKFWICNTLPALA